MEQLNISDLQQVKSHIKQQLDQLTNYIKDIEQTKADFYKQFFETLELPIPYEKIINAEVSPLHSDILQAMILDFMFNDCSIDFQLLQQRFKQKIQELSTEQRQNNQKIYNNIVKIIQIAREQIKIYQQAGKEESYEAAQKIITLFQLLHNSSNNDKIHYPSFLSTFDFSAINRSLFGAEARQQLLGRYEAVRKENIALKSQISNIGSLQHFQDIVRTEEKSRQIISAVNNLSIRYAGIQQTIQQYINFINQILSKIDQLSDNFTLINDFQKYIDKDVLLEINLFKNNEVIDKMQSNDLYHTENKQLTESDLEYQGDGQQNSQQLTGFQLAQYLNNQKQQIQTLQVLVDQQSVQNTTQISQLEQSMTSIKEQKNQVHQLENELLQIKNEFELYQLDKEETIKQLTLENQQNNDIIDQLKFQIQQQVVEMSQSQQVYQKQIYKFKRQQKEKELEINQILQNNNQLQNNIQELNEEKYKLVQQVKLLEEQYNQVHSENATIKAENEEKQQTITDLIQEHNNIKSKLEQDINDLKQQQIEEKQTYDEIILYMQQSYDREIEVNQALNQTIDSQKSKLDALQEQLQQYSQQQDKINLSNILLKNKIENVITLEKNYIQGVLSNLKEQCVQIQNANNIQFITEYLVSLYTKQNHEIESSKQQFDHNVEELYRIKQENQILAHSVTNYEQAISELKLSNKDLTSQISQHLNKINNIQAELLSQQQNNQIEVQKLNDIIKDLQLSNQQLTLKNEQLTSNYIDIQKQMQNSVVEKEKYDKQIEDLRQQNTKLQLDYNNATNRLNITINDYKQQLNSEKTKQQQLNEQNKRIQFELDECKQKLSKQHNSDAEVYKREQEIQRLKSEINDLQQTIQKKDTQVQQLSREIDDKQNQQKQLQQLIDNIQTHQGGQFEINNEGVHTLEKQHLEEENQRNQDLLNAYKNKVSELTRQNNESLTKINQMESQLQAYIAEKNCLINKIEIYEQRIAKLEDQLKFSEDRLAESNMQLKNVSHSLQASQIPKGENISDFPEGVSLILDKSYILQQQEKK